MNNITEIAGLLPSALITRVMPELFQGFTTSLPYGEGVTFGSALRTHLSGDLAGRFPDDRVLGQPHGAEIHYLSRAVASPEAASTPTVTSEVYSRGMAPFDGIAASGESPGLLLTIRVADCVPLLAVDGETGAFAALHAGWRGTAAGILPALLRQWQRGGSTLREVALSLGPSIAPCCFEVREDCTSQFDPAHLEDALRVKRNATFLDLHRVLTRQATALGVDPGRVERIPLCTSCFQSSDGTHPYASYRRSRREGGATDGRNACVIGLPLKR